MVYDPATRTLYGIEDLNPVPNGDAIQLTVPNDLDALPNAFNPPRTRPKAQVGKKKRKKSAYQVWADKERPKIVKQHPRFSFGRINQELGKRWKREKKKRGMK